MYAAAKRAQNVNHTCVYPYACDVPAAVRGDTRKIDHKSAFALVDVSTELCRALLRTHAEVTRAL